MKTRHLSHLVSGLDEYAENKKGDLFLSGILTGLRSDLSGEESFKAPFPLACTLRNWNDSFESFQELLHNNSI